MLRSEIGASPNVAMGVNTINQMDQTLRRVQERLWTEHDWDFGYIERDEDLLTNQKYYTFDPEVDYDRIVSTHVSFSEIWHPVDYGIGPNEYNQFDSNRGQATEPVLRWRHYEGNQFEVWPVPTTSNQKLRFKAIKKLPPLIADNDRAVLDDNLIVLYAATEFLARAKAEDAQAKLAQANSLHSRLKGMGLKRDRFIYGGGIDRNERLRIVGGRFVRDDRF